ncbi:hypothetical protein NE237_023242 [Protea cynaroides]|uniref:TIR domain-containing protein n=1 Tax=Protea cynaroides TaxID=273540 RepID=A0A9Q0K6G5_9MAGN|nr:hypothetical protein NE237_023242 [Protea cynaroides]
MNYGWVRLVFGFVIDCLLILGGGVLLNKLIDNKPVSPKKKKSSVSSSSSSTSSSGWNYEVFLSFRGEDARNSFTDHLCKALKDNGIHTFRDNDELKTGEAIGPELLAAIQQSTISIPIFSRDYASSKWCLIEIAMIAECKKKGQIVLPIFYRVEPKEVRYQIGSFAEAFRKHERHFDEETVRRWREALAEVGNLKGWALDKNRKVESLHLDFGYASKDHYLKSEGFQAMSKLRLLRIDYANLVGNSEHLFSKLRWLSWKGCPLEFTPANFYLEELVVLDLSQSNVTEDWKGWQQMKKSTSLVEIDDSIGHLKSLVFLILIGCDSLVEFPTSICKLSSLQNLSIDCNKLQKLPTELGLIKGLKELIIVIALHMEHLPESIGLLKKLTSLIANYCSALTELPNSIDSIGGLVSLEKLDLSSTNTSEIPDSIGNIRNLTFLRLDLPIVMRLPDSVGLLEKLEVLSTRHCKRLVKQPCSIGRLRHLRCFDWVHLPAGFETLSSLKKLSIGGLKFLESKGFCESLGSLCSLEELLLYNWAISEGEILGDIGRLSSLGILKLENSNFCNLPVSICSLSILQSLEIRNCPDLQSLPKLPSSLRVLEAEDNSSMKTLSDISNLTNLEELNLQFCRKLVEIPTDIGSSTKLQSLYLGKSDISTLPPSTNALNRLKILDIHSCEKLKNLPELPSSVIDLNSVNCKSMERLPNLSNLKKLKHPRLDGRVKLVEIQGLEELECLLDSITTTTKLELDSLITIPWTHYIVAISWFFLWLSYDKIHGQVQKQATEIIACGASWCNPEPNLLIHLLVDSRQCPRLEEEYFKQMEQKLAIAYCSVPLPLCCDGHCQRTVSKSSWSWFDQRQILYGTPKLPVERRGLLGLFI